MAGTDDGPPATLRLPKHCQIARTMRIDATVTGILAAAVLEQRDMTACDGRSDRLMVSTATKKPASDVGYLLRR